MRSYHILFISIIAISSLLLFSNLIAAQKPGSCQEQVCGKYNQLTSCQCDTASLDPKYDDYCEDIQTVCPDVYAEAKATGPQPIGPTSSGSCKNEATGGKYCGPTGSKSPSGCYCDAACEKQNPIDCCPDYYSICKDATSGGKLAAPLTELQPPIALQCADTADNAIRINWLAFSGSKFRLDWCREDLSFDELNIVGPTLPFRCQWAVTENLNGWATYLSPDTTYKFRVRAEHPDFLPSGYSDIITCKTKSDGTLDLSIEKVTLATGEEITEKTSIPKDSKILVHVKLKGADIGLNSPYKDYKVEFQQLKIDSSGKKKALILMLVGAALTMASQGKGQTPQTLRTIGIATETVGALQYLSAEETKNLDIVDSTTITSHQRDTVKIVELKANLDKGKRRINILINPFKKVGDQIYGVIPETTYDNNIWRNSYDLFEIK